MTVPVQTPFTSSVANGVTTVFPYNFMIADDDDMKVVVDDVVQTSGYTVTGIGNPAGGDVIFSVAPANGLKVLRYLDPLLKRETDYQQFGDFLADTVNLDFDKIWLALQAINQNFKRSLKLPVDTTTDQAITEDATSRIGKVVSFDSSGNMVLLLPADLSAATFISTYMETLLAAIDAADARTILELVIGTDVQAFMDSASQVEMEAGTEAALRAMSPLRVKQAITALAPMVQIQPISASVGSNALTISASALSLDFRSATLGSGTVTKVSGTPANLVISSGSTLGTVSGQQSDIAVLAINNAGAIELAAVNIAGGTNLDETGVISTTAEGGAGAADSATVVYSTTARTNVAYRVIGIIRSTQTTAGTWATAPSLIQGAGGNALTALQSLGYGQTWQDVTGSRTKGTTYYNTTGKPIAMNVVMSTTATGQSLLVTVNGVTAINFTTMNSFNQHAFCIIPAGASYSVSGTSSAVQSWTELR